MEGPGQKSSTLLTNRELADMFMGTLTGPFFNFLIGSYDTVGELTWLFLCFDRNCCRQQDPPLTFLLSKKGKGEKNKKDL